MPPEALYLRCDKLDVLSHNENGVTHQEMRARGRVVAQSREFSGTGELVTYDEAKGQVIFHGSAMEPAVLYRQLKPGTKPDEVKARKITYNRTSGQIRIDEGSSLGGS
jgi:lipopolysaccharide export system protein LptA